MLSASGFDTSKWVLISFSYFVWWVWQNRYLKTIVYLVTNIGHLLLKLFDYLKVLITPCWFSPFCYSSRWNIIYRPRRSIHQLSAVMDDFDIWPLLSLNFRNRNRAHPCQCRNTNYWSDETITTHYWPKRSSSILDVNENNKFW